MKLYLLRHGIAEDHAPSGRDADRALLPAGIRQMQAQAEAFMRMRMNPSIIYTSPYRRAYQTAEIVANALRLEDEIWVEESLACGCRLSDLQSILDGTLDERVMIVGHNPDLPIMAGQLAGGAHIELKKGGLIRIDTPRIEPGAGTIEWVLTPALIIGSEQTG